MSKAFWWKRTFERWIGTTRRGQLAASPVSEQNVSQGVNWGGLYRDRYDYDRQQVLDQALLAWRLNPLARRLVDIQQQFVTDQIEIACDDPASQRFLQDLWAHPLNRIGDHLKEWCDELTLTGNLFLAVTTDRAGMSYLRVFPTDLIAEIETAPNDVQQETAYLPKASADDPDPVHVLNFWASEHPASIARSGDTSRQSRAHRDRRPRTVMLHYAVNRLAGMAWGEPDLAPLLPWLGRYAAWLEDRVRLNRFRQAYLYTVKGKYASEQERQARQTQLQNNPPQPGSILVIDEGEVWDVLNPKLDSFEANNDGLALKKFIAAGRGYPLHWLAEPESSTRTTAEAAGTPTFEGLEARQESFHSLLKDVLQVTLQRAAARGAAVRPSARINVTGADISERDNAALALASTQVIESFGQLWANGFIDADEYLRIVYRFSGEVLPAARPDSPKSAGPRPAPRPASSPAAGIQVDTGTGDVKTKEPRS